MDRRTSSITVMALSVALVAGCAHVEPPPLARPDVRELAPAAVPTESPIGERAEPMAVVDEGDLSSAESKLPITRDGAILTALHNNTALDVASYGPQISNTFIPEEKAVFDPELLSTVSFGEGEQELSDVQAFQFDAFGGPGAGGQLISGDLEQTVQNITNSFIQFALTPEPQNTLEQESSAGDIRVSAFLPTGTTVFLSGGLERTLSNFTSEEFRGSATIGFTQSLLEGRGRDVNLVALRQAANRATQSRSQFRQEVLDVVRDVERAYWDLVTAEQIIEVREFGVLLAEEQLSVNRDLVETGRAVDSALLAAQAELSSREADLTEAIGDRRRRVIELLRLMNPDGNVNWDLDLQSEDPPDVTHLMIDSAISETLAMIYRPELRQQELELANRSLDTEVTKNALLPELNFSAQYGTSSLGPTLGRGLDNLEDTSFDRIDLSLELRVPIGNRRDKTRHRRARLNEQQAAAVLADVRIGIAAQVRDRAIDVETQWQRIQSTEQAVESRSEELRIEEDRYQVGMATNLDVLEVQRLLIESRVEAVTARTNYIQALTDLYWAEGTLLERRGVEFESYEEAAVPPAPDPTS